MKLKITMHYAFSFFISALFLVLVNIFFMQSYVYQNEELYYYDSEPYFEDIFNNINFTESSLIEVSSDLEKLLKEKDIGFQVLDERLEEVLQMNSPSQVISKSYTAETLIKIYNSKLTTAFIKEIKTVRDSYTVILFMNPDHINRKVYTYDERAVNAAYNPLWLIGMNVVLLLMVSYMYTYSISRPIHRINAGIIKLSKGDYNLESPSKNIYQNVEVAMNTLAHQLETAQQERILSELSREEWISNLSHDIKTPLTSMMGYGELLGDPEDELSDEEIIKYKDIILEKGHYIEKLLEDLNLATRLKHGQLPLKLETIELISEVKSLLIDILNDSSHENEVAFTYTTSPVYLKLDIRLFKRVIVNLVSNAFVHNAEPVSVQVHINGDDSTFVTMTIEDAGEGINEDELENIFTRYYRGTHTSTKTEGTGLGLAIAKDIIQAHKGYIKAERSNKGGLKIIIKLKRDNL
ncbi:MAG: HAMP domain-containing histidine kinase [Clostridiales bacterium]|nr:HAMP domain-containing histidine kinase [Clostridiales bacterium]